MNKQEQLISLAKRRGFIFQSSSIYGGFSGVYDYGPMGVELKNNIKKIWWQSMVKEREDIMGIDSSIFTSPKVWEASGHLDNFSDPLVICKKTDRKFRLDHLLEEIGVNVSEQASLEELTKLFNKHKTKFKLEGCRVQDLSDPVKFNLLVSSNLGNVDGSSDMNVYLRGETCQGIYINYKNVIDSMHPTIPFGIAQIGKAFRNEISPRNYIFRLREFEQMEMQYFIKPKDQKKYFNHFIEYRKNFLINIGLDENKLRFQKHKDLVFYAKDAIDIEYEYSFGFKELEGIHNRGDYDLTQHSKCSNVTLEYKDLNNNEHFTPCVIETSIGLDRLFLALLDNAYTEESLSDGTSRTVLKLNKDIAPIYIAILPLFKKEKLIAISKQIFNTLKYRYNVFYDETQSIGKRYRRQDEVGTPYCLTIDYESIQDDCVTIRDRDSMMQERIKIEDLLNYFTKLDSSNK